MASSSLFDNSSFIRFPSVSCVTSDPRLCQVLGIREQQNTRGLRPRELTLLVAEPVSLPGPLHPDPRLAHFPLSRWRGGGEGLWKRVPGRGLHTGHVERAEPRPGTGVGLARVGPVLHPGASPSRKPRKPQKQPAGGLHRGVQTEQTDTDRSRHGLALL